MREKEKEGEREGEGGERERERSIPGIDKLFVLGYGVMRQIS